MEERHVFTVTELNNCVKELVESVPAFGDLLLRGEVSNYKQYPSGHHYFTLKDSQSALRCVMFKGAAAKLRFKPENGMQVIASGRISVYPRDGAYQLYCSSLSADGVGDLYVAFEQLKDKLPAYMIPNRYEVLAEMPTNLNGKIDRTLLKQQYIKEN